MNQDPDFMVGELVYFKPHKGLYRVEGWAKFEDIKEQTEIDVSSMSESSEGCDTIIATPIIFRTGLPPRKNLRKLYSGFCFEPTEEHLSIIKDALDETHLKANAALDVFDSLKTNKNP